MDPTIRTIIGTLAAVVMIVLLVWGRVVWAIHRTRLSPIDDAPPEERPFDACEQAAIAELEAWGFDRVATWTDTLGAFRVPALLLAHRRFPAFACLVLRQSTLMGYPVTFVSFDADGAQQATGNRQDWMRGTSCDSTHTVDARADSLAAQWQAHQARMATAVPVPPDEAVRRIREQIEADRAASLATGLWRTGRSGLHLSFASALRATRGLMRDRRALARPFECAATSAALAPTFLAGLLASARRLEAVRNTPRTTRALLLIASMVVGLALWGVAFDLRFAAVLVAVLLVHEAGHAVAMRAFGWRDLHMFMIPFMGAVVTGSRPRDLPAWQEAIVLLAGPVPGLLAGLAVLALPHAPAPLPYIATIAIVINAFNLLPLHPLDGGRLLEIALFGRWPRARLGFLAASIAGLAALAWWSGSVAAGAIAALLALSFRRSVTLAELERRVAPGRDMQAVSAQVARVVLDRLPGQGLARQFATGQVLVQRRTVCPARVRESVAIVAVLVLLWGAAVYPVARRLGPPSRAAAEQPRTPVRAFDQAFNRARMDDSDEAWREVQSRESTLDADDPRHRDVAWMRARRLPEPARRAALADWLAQPADGRSMSHSLVLRIALHDWRESVRDEPPSARAVALRAALAWARDVQPGSFAPTLDTRLRLAEAIDLSGDASGAQDELARIAEQARTATDCEADRCAIDAQWAWFELAHGHGEAALRRLDAALEARRAAASPSDDQALSVERAWALLLTQGASAAVGPMRTALHAERLDRSATSASEDDEFDDDDLMDLLAVESLAGEDGAARTLATGRASDTCHFHAARAPGSPVVPEGPWQAPRVNRWIEQARRWCPPAGEPPRVGS